VVIILAFFLYNEWVDGDHEVQGPRSQLTWENAKMCQPRQGKTARPWSYI